MGQFGKVEKQKNIDLRASGTDSMEPGHATFKIGSEAGGVDRKITGGDWGPLFGNEFNVASVGEQILFDDRHGLGFVPANKKHKSRKLKDTTGYVKLKPSLQGSKTTMLL